jgi:dolichol-phosphate mannosyltransferase
METGENSLARFTIVLPTYNEVENISILVEELFCLYPGVSISVIDDGSADGTVEAVLALQKKHDKLALTQRNPENKGLTAALMEGISAVKTDFYVVMDADFQHPPASVVDLMAKVSGGADLVVGVRVNKGPLTLSRRIASGGAHKLAAGYLWLLRRPRSRDVMSGFFGGRTDFSRQVISKHGRKFERKGFKMLFDLMKHSPRDTRLEEAQFIFGERAGGESKLNSDIILSVVKQCGLAGKMLGTTIQLLVISKAAQVIGLLILVAIFAIAIVIGTTPHQPTP